MSLFKIQKIQRATGIPQMTLFEIAKIQRTTVIPKQPGVQLSHVENYNKSQFKNPKSYKNMTKSGRHQRLQAHTLGN